MAEPSLYILVDTIFSKGAYRGHRIGLDAVSMDGQIGPTVAAPVFVRKTRHVSDQVRGAVDVTGTKFECSPRRHPLAGTTGNLLHSNPFCVGGPLLAKRDLLVEELVPVRHGHVECLFLDICQLVCASLQHVWHDTVAPLAPPVQRAKRVLSRCPREFRRSKKPGSETSAEISLGLGRPEDRMPVQYRLTAPVLDEHRHQVAAVLALKVNGEGALLTEAFLATAILCMHGATGRERQGRKSYPLVHNG